MYLGSQGRKGKKKRRRRMAWRLSTADVCGFKFLISLAVMYGLMAMLAYSVLQMKFIKPLGIQAPLDRFSEARALQHVRVLSKDIDGRHEGRPGLQEAANYIKGQLEKTKERAGSHIRVDIEESIVNGSFKMMFLGHSITLAYRNHTNIEMRISSADSKDTDPSLLLNGHFDSHPGSPGAADCGSCVASMLELARLTVDSGWVPPRPIIFLFNGAEELFMLGSHGFMKTHKWHDTVGAFINLEATGTGGLDLVCQSGPGSWPSQVYAQSAVYPMAHSAAQDVFPIIPGDTDYRIFSQDFGNIPGLDIIFLLGGYFYHTSFDTMERLLPGSIQARGENVFSLMKAFANSSKLRNARGSELLVATDVDERSVFFDYLTWFMVFYSRRVAMVLHSIPIAVFLIVPFILYLLYSGLRSWFAIICDFTRGILFHFAGIILAIIVPILFSILRLLFSSHPMSWFAYPYLAFMMFVPCSLVGLLIPSFVWSCIPLSQDISILKTSREVLSDEARFWGAFGFYAILTSAYLLAGLRGGFLIFFVSASMLAAWTSFCLSKSYSFQPFRVMGQSLIGGLNGQLYASLSMVPDSSLLYKQYGSSILFYVIPLIPCLTYSVYFGGFLVQFLIERMGMMGAVPPPYGYFIPDIIVAALVGVATGLCVGPLIPACSHWLARSSIIQFLLHLTVFALALSSQFFPYSMNAPKRVIFQHTVLTAGGNQVVDCTYDFSVLDSNSLAFVFNHAPEAANELHIGSEFSFETATVPHRETWMVLFPVSFLFSRSLKIPTKSDDVRKQYSFFPHLSIHKPHTISRKGSRRIYLKLYFGSLEEVWVAVLNITGPLSSWSFADNILPAPETVDGGPPSYICRLSGASHENWTFWLEGSNSENLRVEVAVLDQKLVDAAKKLKSLFPDWVDVTAYSSYMSSYIF